ncbi:hypothetical protein NQZ68_000720 [Dissostichus eleginoides]|nr:hypothetical protein NQZ68_000720 [Dissostichus eleginoides]
MVASCLGGNLEPINLGNFSDKKRASRGFDLVGCTAHLCLRLVSLIRPIAYGSFFLLSSAQLSKKGSPDQSETQMGGKLNPQERDMRTVGFADAVHSDRSWKDTIGTFPHV